MKMQTRISLALLAFAIATAAFLFYGPSTDSPATLAAWIALPLTLGALLSNLLDPDGSLPPMGCFVFPTLALFALVGLTWLVAREGAVCIVMLLPIWLPVALAGWLMQRINIRLRRKRGSDQSQTNAVGWALLPLLILTIEGRNLPQWQTRSITREVRIEAAPDQVWPLLLSVPDIAPNEGRWNLTQNVLGIPRPRDAQLKKEKSVLVRKAQWGSGIRFDERIHSIKTGRTIAWDFEFIDDSVTRNTDRHISPDGPFLKIAQGQYDLVANNDGSSTLRQTTTYRMRTRLPGYFAWWGERLLGDIQSNVLVIIKNRASA